MCLAGHGGASLDHATRFILIQFLVPPIALAVAMAVHFVEVVAYYCLSGWHYRTGPVRLRGMHSSVPAVSTTSAISIMPHCDVAGTEPATRDTDACEFARPQPQVSSSPGAPRSSQPKSTCLST